MGSDFKARIFTSWQTFVSGAVGAVATLLVNYGINISDPAKKQASDFIVAGTLLALGYFSKDANKSGKPE
jgi:hypothetical protein